MSKSLNTSEVVDNIADKTGSTKADTKRFITALEEVVSEALVEDRKVLLGGFLAFEPTVRAARTMRNPATGEAIDVPERKTVRIRALKKLKDTVQGEETE